MRFILYKSWRLWVYFFFWQFVFVYKSILHLDRYHSSQINEMRSQWWIIGKIQACLWIFRLIFDEIKRYDVEVALDSHCWSMLVHTVLSCTFFFKIQQSGLGVWACWKSSYETFEYDGLSLMFKAKITL